MTYYQYTLGYRKKVKTSPVEFYSETIHVYNSMVTTYPINSGSLSRAESQLYGLISSDTYISAVKIVYYSLSSTWTDDY